MVPEPSKRSFHFPIPAEALPYFCHPTLEPFTAPVSHDGLAYAASGFVALRVRRFQGYPEDLPDCPPFLLKRLLSLPWDDFGRETARTQWRLMDDARGTIYRGGPLPLWLERKGKAILSRDTLVRTAGGPLVPLALLQLIARLPRVEIRMVPAVNSDITGQPILFRFSGGEGIIPALYKGLHPRDIPVEAFSLFNPKPGPLLPGGLV